MVAVAAELEKTAEGENMVAMVGVDRRIEVMIFYLFIYLFSPFV